MFLSISFISLVIITNQSVFADKIFNLQGKIALITGASRGIGFAIADELLKNGVQGITIVSVNAENGQKAANALNKKYGYGKVIFVEADVGNSEQFEAAFNTSMQHWKALDILVNNAGIVNENKLKSMVNTNIMGVLHGTFLGFKYMSKSTGGHGGVIINIASIFGIDPLMNTPVYSATKHFVIGLDRSLGHQVYYDYNNVRVLTLCPGVTQTDIVDNIFISITNTFNPHNSELLKEILEKAHIQSVHSVAKALAYIAEQGSSGSVWVSEDDQPPYEVEYPDRKSMQKKN